MANRTRSHQQRRQIGPKTSPKRIKPRTQTTPNQYPNRANLVSDVTQSLSASDAAVRLGVSVSTVKRMCTEGKLTAFRTRGPRGHLRIPSEALEKIRQGAVASAAPSGLVATKRANLEEIRLELDERKLKREVSKLDEEDSAAARERAAAQRTQQLAAKARLKELRLQAARDDERRRTAALEEERRKWRRNWMRGVENELALDEFSWLSAQQAAAVKVAADIELDRFDIEDTREIVGPALDHAIERTVRPWRAVRDLVKKSIEGHIFWDANPEQKARAAGDVRAALSQLPSGASDVELQAVVAKAIEPVKREIEEHLTRRRREQLIESAAHSLPWSATEGDKMQAVDAVRSALSRVPLQANQAHERDVVARILSPIKKAVQERWTAQQDAQAVQKRHAQQKSLLISIATLDASNYLSEMNEDGEIQFDPGEDFGEVSQKIEAAVRDQLGKELAGSESQDEANRIAREIVDEELG